MHWYALSKTTGMATLCASEQDARREAKAYDSLYPKAAPHIATRLQPAGADTERLDWMDANLCRAGEVRDANGACIKLARTWAIMGEFETLRDTVDAAMTANAD